MGLFLYIANVMTLTIEYNSENIQQITFVSDRVTIGNYIEFIADQSDLTISQNFVNISVLDRVVVFEIITKDLFTYAGWYTYKRYTDNTKSELIEVGKIYLSKVGNHTVYNKPENEKIIYSQ